MSSSILGQLVAGAASAERQAVIDEACRAEGGFSLRGIALEGCDLSGLNLMDVRMEGVDLRGADCRNVSFPALVDCVLGETDASGSTFPRLSGCQLQRATLRATRIGGRISNCDFSEANLQWARIGPILAPHRREYGTNLFWRANVRGIDAAGAYLPGTSFTMADLAEARLSRADMGGCDLTNASLASANLLDTCLRDARLRDVRWDECMMTREQAAELREIHKHELTGLRFGRKIDWSATAALEAALASSPGYRLDCHFRSEGKFRPEMIIITNWTTSKLLRAYAFESESHEFVRMYPVEGPANLRSILLDLASDYANWAVETNTMRAQLSADSTDTYTTDVFCTSMGELFEVTDRVI